MTIYRDTAEFLGAEFRDADMSGAEFREVDLTGIRMRGVVLINANIDGYLQNLTINGVDVVPLIEAELDRLHPERLKLRLTTPEGMREAWDAVESFWAVTMERAGKLGEDALHRSVDDEWSFTETLRHLVIVTDSWLNHATLGEAQPFHPLGMPPSYVTDAASFGIDIDASPTYADVLAVRACRMARVREFVDSLTQAELDRVRGPNHAPGGPAPAERDALTCLRVILNDEWAHHQFAIRDLAIIEGES